MRRDAEGSACRPGHVNVNVNSEVLSAVPEAPPVRHPSVWAEESLVKDRGLPGHPDQYSWLLGADVSGGRSGKGLCPRGLFFFFFFLLHVHSGV